MSTQTLVLTVCAFLPDLLPISWPTKYRRKVSKAQTHRGAWVMSTPNWKLSAWGESRASDQSGPGLWITILNSKRLYGKFGRPGVRVDGTFASTWYAGENRKETEKRKGERESERPKETQRGDSFGSAFVLNGRKFCLTLIKAQNWLRRCQNT